MATHISVSGERVQCNATQRTCPRGGHEPDILSQLELESTSSLVIKNVKFKLKTLTRTVGEFEATKFIDEHATINEYGDFVISETAPDPLLERTEKIKNLCETYNNLPEDTNFDTIVEEMLSNDTYIKLIQEREQVKEQIDLAKQEFSELKTEWENDPNKTYEETQQKGFELIELREELAVLKQQIEIYKNTTANMVNKSSLVLRDGYEFVNNVSGETRPIIREPNEIYIGGSQAGVINGEYSDSIKELMEIKAGLKEATPPLEGEGPAWRGNVWEPAIINTFADNHPDINIQIPSKTVQSLEHPNQIVRPDGILKYSDGTVGILEIKTASDPSKWGDPAEGLEAIPDNYRTQMLWTAQVTGIRKGVVAVLIDDKEYREYPFEINESHRESLDTINRKVNNFIINTTAAHEAGEIVSTRNRSTYSASELNGSMRNAPKKELYKRIALIRGISPEDVEEGIVGPFESGLVEKTPDNIKAAFRAAYKIKPGDNPPRMVGLDIETSGSSPQGGHIIELGTKVLNPFDGEPTTFQKLYGVTERAAHTTGTGLVDVHLITLDDVRGKPLLRDYDNQNETMSLLMPGTVLVAHNASFEKNWLTQHVDGFADALKRKEISIIDSMSIAKHVVVDAPNNKLESLVETAGMSYEGAHRADRDAAMMMEAMDWHLRS